MKWILFTCIRVNFFLIFYIYFLDANTLNLFEFYNILCEIYVHEFNIVRKIYIISGLYIGDSIAVKVFTALIAVTEDAAAVDLIMTNEKVFRCRHFQCGSNFFYSRKSYIKEKN